MTAYKTSLTTARQRLSRGVLLLITFGNLLLAGVALLWLWIPDSHTWQLVLSALFAVIIAVAFLLCNAIVLQRIRSAHPAAALWTGALTLGAWLVLAALVFHLVGLATTNIETRAGYWNSQLSRGLRALLPYSRLISLQSFVIDAARWVLLPGLLLPLVMESVTFGLHASAFRRALRVWRSWQHWAVALPALGIVLWLIPRLTDWHPAHTVSGETLSAVLRLTLAALLALLAVLAVLLTDAELLHRAAVQQSSTKAQTTD